MKTVRAACTLSLLCLAGAAFAADQQSAPPQPGTYYYWLHPKLGMVKVCRANNAIITSRQACPQKAAGGRS